MSSWRAWSAAASRAGGGRRCAEVEAQRQAAAGGARRSRRTAAASPGGGSLTALVGDQEPGGVRRFVGFEGVGFGQEWLSPALLSAVFRPLVPVSNTNRYHGTKGTLVPVCTTNRYQRSTPQPQKIAREPSHLWYRFFSPTGSKGYFSLFLFLFY